DDLGAVNYICNGSFEYPVSSLNPHDWQYLNADIFQNNNPADNIGLAYCGTHFVNVLGEGISQRVYLPAGPLYLHFRIRRRYFDYPYGGPPRAQVEIASASSGDVGLNWVVLDGKTDDGASHVVMGSAANFYWFSEEYSHTFLTPSAGWYDVKFENIIPPYTEVIAGTPRPQPWFYQYDRTMAYQLDDITLSSIGYQTYCSGPGGATATPAVSPTAGSGRGATPTRTVTPGGPTQTPAPVSSFQNCDFEQGLAGWSTVGAASVKLAGGPIGPQFARAIGPLTSVYQAFTWGGGTAYFTFWIGPGSGGSVHIQRAAGFGASYDTTLWAHSESSPVWKLITAQISNLQSGTYKIAFYGTNFNNMDIDGVMPSYNTYRYCGAGTPTPGPTSFVTSTPSRTPTAGPSSTAIATRTPTVTNTPNATWTPSNTPTAAPPSATPLPPTATNTPTTPPSATPSGTPGNDATATALASVTPATSTATPAASVTAPPTNTPMPPTASPIPNPNPQPEPAPSADCQRPDNPFNLAGWMEFEVCQVLKWTLWNDENSTQMLNIQATLQVYEPMGTLNELSDARNTLSDEINQYDWANTGLQSGELPDLSILIPDNTPTGLLTGNFDLTPDPGSDFAFVRTCGLQIADVFGDAMSQGMCAAINWMIATGILNWVQYLFDLAIWIAFLRYGWWVVTNVIPTML
ncbi:MAG: hypothetical protein ABI847_04375, partial [Anaerolineales bacterium]